MRDVLVPRAGDNVLLIVLGADIDLGLNEALLFDIDRDATEDVPPKFLWCKEIDPAIKALNLAQSCAFKHFLK